MDNRRNNRIDPWDDGVFGTGKTEPPKNNSGVVALMMIIIILLSGIISVLSFMNIRLFHQLQEAQYQSDSIPMAFSEQEAGGENSLLRDDYDDTDTVFIQKLGLSGEYVSKFDQHYFRWPAGLLVTDVESQSKSHALGLEPGDILTCINGTPVTSQEELDAILASGIQDPIYITIYRDGAQLNLPEN